MRQADSRESLEFPIRANHATEAPFVPFSFSLLFPFDDFGSRADSIDRSLIYSAMTTFFGVAEQAICAILYMHFQFQHRAIQGQIVELKDIAQRRRIEGPVKKEGELKIVWVIQRLEAQKTLPKSLKYLATPPDWQRSHNPGVSEGPGRAPKTTQKRVSGVGLILQE